MQKNIFFGLLLIISLASASVSCGHKTESDKQTKLVFGNIIHKVCQADTTQSYEIYLPTGYSSQKKYPVIYSFDPHADGKLAITNLREAAERFGFIVAGSDNSKNGVTNIEHILDVMVNDIQQNYPVDTQRQYAAGFSGGGRVAAILASRSGHIKGIITCGAGFDSRMSNVLFDVYAIAGREDFNYDEVMSMNQQMANTNWRFITASFHGGHNWPPVPELTQAVLWFQLNAMRDNLIQKEDNLAEQERDSFLVRADHLIGQNQLIHAANECQQGISFLDGLISVKKLKNKLKDIQSQDAYVKENEKAGQLRYMEQQLRQGYLQAFSSKDLNWWKNEIQGLNTRIQQEKNPADEEMYKRIKAFLGIVCYSFASKAITEKDQAQTNQILEIYQLVEPENPDCFFYKAVSLDRQGKTNEAADNYRQALAHGFTDASKAKEMLSEKVRSN